MKAMQLLKTAGRVIDLNSPLILTCLAVGGLVGTVILMKKADKDAEQMIKEEKERRAEEVKKEDEEKEVNAEEIELPLQDTVKVTWKAYVPVAIMGVATMACIIGSNRISAKRNLMLSSAMAAAEAAAKEYQQKVIDVVGASKEEKIHNEIHQDKVRKAVMETDLNNEDNIFNTRVGNTLFFDEFSGRIFRSDWNEVKKIENELNRRMMVDMEMFISVNDFYLELGIPTIKYGDQEGWSVEDGEIRFLKHPTAVDKNGERVLCWGLEYDTSDVYRRMAIQRASELHY